MKKFAKVAVPLPINKLFTYEIPDELLHEVEIGKRCLVPFGKQNLTGYIVGFEEKCFEDEYPSGLKKITSVSDLIPVFDKEILELAEWISSYYICSIGEALSASLPIPAISKLVKTNGDGFIFQKYLFPTNSWNKNEPVPICFEDNFILTGEQKNSLQTILSSVKNKKFETILIHGVTGSGKTEIYIRSIKEVIKQAKTAIVLVPEISLTPQIVERFRTRFGNKISLWHSRLSKKERVLESLRILKGESRIVIGARSAIFAPLKNIGLIIIDEEHENTYKQEDTPRYHVRNVAMKRAQMNSAVLLLGTATPSIETYFKAVTGEYKLCTLSKRVDNRLMPELKIVDMKEEKEKKSHILSEELKSAIKDRLLKNEQIILFLNRRGFSTYILCKECGYSMNCPNCSVSLTYHSKDRLMRCHYCGYKEVPPLFCPNCKGTYVKFLGKGTQKVESEINGLYPSARILRMDTDITRKKNSFVDIFNAFQKKEADVLIGTQMVVKGFDFPSVTLVGIISADTSLNFPDFRSAERTFQLVTQAAGRSGRGDKKGLVIIQTYNADHYSIQASLTQNYLNFYSNEITKRKEVEFPPFSNLVNIVVKGKDEKKVVEKIQEIDGILKSKKSGDIEIFGPSPAPLSKLESKYRWHIVLKGKDINKISELLKSCTAKFNVSGNVHIAVDVDPVNMM